MPTGVYKRIKKTGGWKIKDTSKMNKSKVGVKLSENHRNKISEVLKTKGIRPPIRKGKDSHFWKGGVTPINMLIRKSTEYRLWRESVFKRDNWTCIWCGVKKDLNADHIKPFAYYPELRFAIDNGRTLCIPCHKTTDTWGINQFTKWQQ